MTPDYEPFDLGAACNAGPEAYTYDTNYPAGQWHFDLKLPPPLGPQTYHGLPFQIGAQGGPGERCFIALGAGRQTGPVQVPLDRSAHHLIFLHALIATRLWEGAPVGDVVATYRFHFADGEVVEAPIRERFEIGNIPLRWGQYPFVAWPDQKDSLADRYSGRWESTGGRQTEANQGAPAAYYLWAWINPRPEAVIRAVEIVPTERLVIIAGLTLGHLPEFPLPRRTRRPVRLTLADPARAARPFDLDVAVDRGVATYPYPLPAVLPGEDMPGLRGFGAPLNTQSSPAYVEIAALPSATVTLRQGGEVLGEASWGEVERRGSVELPGARLELIDPGKNWVKVQVVDDDTGRRLPCRVAFLSPEGVPFAPHGHHAPLFSNLNTWHIDVGGDVRLGQIAYAYIDGHCQGWLPRGRCLVDVGAGFEYEPQRRWVEIEPGQQALTLRLKRWINMNADGWYSGDTHVHFLSSQGALLEAQGEGLNVVNLLLSQWGHLFTNTEEFTGRPLQTGDGQTIVYASQENRQHLLGHLTLLGLKEPVMPWCSAGPSEAELGGGLDVTLSHWADACHAQGGTVVIPHLPEPNAEPATLIATGRADAVEFLRDFSYFHHEYYRYLNGGYRLPLVGGTDKMDCGVPVGLYRAYVHLPPDMPFTYDNWCQALRAGRSFLSGGALLWLEVDGQQPGATLLLKGGGTVEVTARAQSIFPIHCLQLVLGGKVVAETQDAAGAKTLSLNTHLRVDSDTWLVARCAGPGYYKTIPHFDSWGRGIMAHTSPVYFTTGDEYACFDPATARYMLTLVEGGLAYVRQASPQYPAGHVTHHHGEADHQAYLERPFLEARDALHKLMHARGVAH